MFYQEQNTCFKTSYSALNSELSYIETSSRLQMYHTIYIFFGGGGGTTKYLLTCNLDTIYRRLRKKKYYTPSQGVLDKVCSYLS